MPGASQPFLLRLAQQIFDVHSSWLTYLVTPAFHLALIPPAYHLYVSPSKRGATRLNFSRMAEDEHCKTPQHDHARLANEHH